MNIVYEGLRLLEACLIDGRLGSSRKSLFPPAQRVLSRLVVVGASKRMEVGGRCERVMIVCEVHPKFEFGLDSRSIMD